MNIIKAQNIFFVGIGGSGMSALAGLLHGQGKTVSGVDQHESQNTHMLDQEGIQVKIEPGPKIPADVELIIYSTAVPAGDLYRTQAHEKNIPQLAYHEALGQLTQQYETIAVCGTHGKTTTTAMLAVVLKDVINPSVIVGAQIPELEGKNYRVGGVARNGKHYLIIEACEYQNHFLHYHPNLILITNIEYDHPDFFKTPQDYEHSFKNFIAKLPSEGNVIDEYQNKELEKQLNLAIPGAHNQQNALAALSAAQKIYPNLDTTKAIDQLNHFTGAARRFQQVATIGTTPIISDYAHHPTAIKATLAAAREKFGPQAKILCIFQPHQHSRTARLLKDFAHCFTQATTVIIPNIYKVRDTAEDIAAISVEQLVTEIAKNHPDARNGHGLEKTRELMEKEARNYDAVLIMGAGDIGNLGETKDFV